jgi:UDP-N-acetylglucosamine transferase subunit ALG13
MKVFVTVGTQLPFDRLIGAVDQWAASRNCEVLAQTGTTQLQPRHIDWKDFIDVSEANERIRTADLVVAHAGMGTILTRLETGLPMIVLPRRADLGEHRNDHQLATVRRLSHIPGLIVVNDEGELQDRMSRFEPRRGTAALEAVASPSLITAIREFVLT